MFLDYWSIDSGSRNLFCGVLAIHDIPCEVAGAPAPIGSHPRRRLGKPSYAPRFLAVSLALDARGKLELAKLQLCASMETLE